MTQPREQSRLSDPSIDEREASSTGSTIDEPQGYSADDRFVRSILRRMVSDPAAIDDLAQDTWLATLRQSGAALYARRAWLGTVARNFALQASRGSARRRQRERAASISESATPKEIDSDLKQELRVALEALDEHYRVVLWHRFFEDLLPTQIADKLGIPVETVRTRLKRGLVALHARLIAARS